MLLNKSKRTSFSFLINLYFVKMTAYVLHFKFISVGLSLRWIKRILVCCNFNRTFGDIRELNTQQWTLAQFRLCCNFNRTFGDMQWTLEQFSCLLKSCSTSKTFKSPIKSKRYKLSILDRHWWSLVNTPLICVNVYSPVYQGKNLPLDVDINYTIHNYQYFNRLLRLRPW